MSESGSCHNGERYYLSSSLGEALAVWAAVMLVGVAVYVLASGYTQLVVAALFLFVPTLILNRRGGDFNAYGLTAQPIARGVGLFATVSGVIFPAFCVGAYGYYTAVCRVATKSSLVRRYYGLICRRFVGNLSAMRWNVDPWLYAENIVAHFVVVALPEEYFFRGYVQTNLQRRWGARWRILGMEIGPAVIATSVLFALGHFVIGFSLLRLAVFFPSLLFGALRQTTGSILASVLFHASCNIVSETVHRLLFGFGA